MGDQIRQVLQNPYVAQTLGRTLEGAGSLVDLSNTALGSARAFQQGRPAIEPWSPTPTFGSQWMRNQFGLQGPPEPGANAPYVWNQFGSMLPALLIPESKSISGESRLPEAESASVDPTLAKMRPPKNVTYGISQVSRKSALDPATFFDLVEKHPEAADFAADRRFVWLDDNNNYHITKAGWDELAKTSRAWSKYKSQE